MLGGAAVVVTIDPLSHVLGIDKGLSVTSASDVYLLQLAAVLDKVHWEVAAIAVVSAYVVGSIFFRQDPKTPDAFSALRLWMDTKPEEREALAAQAAPDIDDPVRREERRQELVARQFHWIERRYAYVRPKRYMQLLGVNAEFPYLSLRCYLIARGLHHLAALVPWCPTVEKSKQYTVQDVHQHFKDPVVRLLSDPL